MQIIVITGINGFVGRHLAKELFTNNIRVIGIGQGEVDLSLEKLIESYHSVDLANEWPALPSVDAIINLAGLAAAGPSFVEPQKYININSAIVTNMCEYYMKQEDKPRIVLVSSGALYDAHQPMPLYETSEIGFGSPYIVSKLLNENQAEYYRRRGLDLVVARPFNHIGPGQGPGFLVPDLLAQIKTSQENNSILRVGNLKTKRDYTDVRDVARAYRLLATTPTLNHQTYNVCSGKSRAGEEILAILQKLTNTQDMIVEVDKSKIRPNDPDNHLGSADRLIEDTRWKPTIELEKTLHDTVASDYIR